jgi:acyl carrier protein
MSVSQRVANILVDILDVDESELTPETSFRSDLGASSIDVVEIVAAVENEFGIKISDKEVQTITTVQGLHNLLKTKVA